MSSLILLDTRNAYGGTGSQTPHDTSFSIEESINDLGGTVTLTECIIPNLRYNITSANNTIIFTSLNGSGGTDGTHTVTIPVGNYDASVSADGAATPIQSIFSAFKTAVTASYTSSSTSCSVAADDLFTFTCPGIATIALELGSTLCSDVLGFTLPVLAAKTITATLPLRLDGTAYVDVCVNQIACNSYSNGSATNVLARVPCNSGFGSILFWSNLHGGGSAQANSMQQLQVYLLDDRQRPFILPSNAHCMYQFQVDPPNY